MRKPTRPAAPPGSASVGSNGRFGVARVLSKRGVCSRSQAEAAVREGRVRVDGRRVLDPQFPTDPVNSSIMLDGTPAGAVERVYVAINKPRGLVVTAADERGRSTVYDLLRDSGLPWLGPVGRLDQASEGLLLLSNDPAWAAGITERASQLVKTYHVQIRGVPDDAALARMRVGLEEAGEQLAVHEVRVLRGGERHTWLQIELDEGRNRHIRRLLAMLDFPVVRLVRTAIGPLPLGQLAKGQWRRLLAAEVEALRTR